MTIGGLKRKFEAVDTNKIILEAMVGAEEMIADLNAEQMHTGIRKDESPITPPYAAVTVAIKRQKGQPVDRITLLDTGAFYKGIYAKVHGDVVEIDSTDPKSEKLQEKYGEEIFGLSGRFRREALNEKIKPELKQKIESATGLKFKK